MLASFKGKESIPFATSPQLSSEANITFEILSKKQKTLSVLKNNLNLDTNTMRSHDKGWTIASFGKSRTIRFVTRRQYEAGSVVNRILSKPKG